MELRLQKARNLLMQTDMSVINVALACGFASPSHFSKCYRAHYDTTPYRERGAQSSRSAILRRQLAATRAVIACCAELHEIRQESLPFFGESPSIV